ncbi:glycosyltransferase family 2 protein [Algibacter marinivivus]|uniref:Glycosyltransferase family 2 protein n=1 Tax=Algibacter marinivivus TaxID=2100723 RepID=A0A2U2X4X0_9FLAO|nr:glycosyltransferase family A protein [Algibacter marinivivus]PWH82794.1 glycosyltransferase family 2 protein [Algibacter marinivivus]
MIYLIHKNNSVQKVLNDSLNELPFEKSKSITSTLYELAKTYPEALLIWCYQDYFDLIDKDSLSTIFHHKRIFASYTVNLENFLPEQIGFVDQSIYLKVNKTNTYPTWLMSSDVGGVHLSLLNTAFSAFNKYKDFDYYLNCLAKTAMSQGLFCYSEPRLFLEKPKSEVNNKATIYQLFKFVKTNYKWVWSYILFFCFVIYLKRFPLLPFLRTLFYSRDNLELDFSSIPLNSNRKVISQKSIDVIIPTIGRKPYLYDVLKDLSKQTILPNNVIIVEQNPLLDSKSELDYLTSEEWPFKIKHRFIHKSGVCNARNIAISLVESEWVFFGDDDIRFEKDLLEKSFSRIESLGVKSINLACLQVDEVQKYLKIAQTPIFGSGTSIVKSELLEHIKFNLSYEYGYGEDSDFGMQIRNLGADVISVPDIIITHLKAPVGGYRIKVEHPWFDEDILPKPAPTIMLLNLNYFTKSQVQAYKLLLFIKFYKHQKIKNPFRYISLMNKKWDVSLFWAKKLQAYA